MAFATVVAVTGGVLAVGPHAAKDVGVASLVLVAAAVYAGTDYFGRCLVISDESIIDQRLVATATHTIMRADVGACVYRSFIAGRPSYFRAIEIRDRSGGQIIDIQRYGWGKNRRRLFRVLAAWLEDAGVALDDRTREFFEKATTH